MGDNGFNQFKQPDPSPFRLFAEAAFLPTFGNSNASPRKGGEHTSQSATEQAEVGASALCKPGTHQWLRPDNGYIECAACGKTRMVDDDAY
jgi:hypothetical protein